MPSRPRAVAVRAAEVVGEDAPRLDAAHDVNAHVPVQRRADVVELPSRMATPTDARLVAPARVEAAGDLPLLVEDVTALLDRRA